MRIATLILTSLALCAHASAQPAGGDGEAQEGAEVIVVRPPDSANRDATRGLALPAFVTVVRPAHDRGDHTVGEALSRTVGVRVRSLGGLGAFSSLSVRGAPSGHTAVLVDGIPLSRIAAVTVDLGRFDLAGVSSLELYRGAVPAELGGAGVGGALNFVTATSRPGPFSTELSAGYGSHDARHAAVRHFGRGDDGTLDYQLAAGYSGATGDFSYFDDGGTNLNTDDDRTATRQNNGFDRAVALLRGRKQLPSGTMTAGARVFAKRQGIPGSAASQTEEASLTTSTWIVDGSYRSARTLFGRRAVVRAGLFALFDQQRYLDRLGEIGVATQDRSYTTSSAGASSSVAAELSERVALTAAIAPTIDVFAERDHGTARVGVRGNRLTANAAASARVVAARERLLIDLSARAEIARTAPTTTADNAFPGDVAITERTDLSLSPRASARVAVADDVSIKTSFGRYLRQPTLSELFGDRGFAVGNPELSPETGYSGDIGAVFAPARRIGPLDRIYVEAVLFGSRPIDAITYVNTASMVARPINIDSARIVGAELVALARVARRVELTANYTLLATRQNSMQPSFDGKKLPQRPRHQAFGRVDVDATRAVRLFVDGTYTSGNFLDRSNLSAVPRRALLGAGVSIRIGPRITLSVDGRNLTDRRVESVALDPAPSPDLTSVPRAISDFFGYPLTGRTVYGTATVRL